MPLWPKSGIGCVSTSATVCAAAGGQESRPVRWFIGEQVQGASGAVGRERGIQRSGLPQGDAVAAERQRQRWVRAVRQAERRTGGTQRSGEAQWSDAVQQGNGRQVERTAQRLAGGDAAGKAAAEVLGRIAAEAARQIRQHGVRRGDAVGKRHGVDEWLQRRTRGAHRLGQVERAGTVLIAPGAGVKRQDLARLSVRDEDGQGHALRQVCQPLLAEAFQCRLQ